MRAFLSDSVFFGAVLTLTCYGLSLALKRRFRLAILNPLLIASICVVGVLCLTGVDYIGYNAGAKIISWFLTPATVCLAVPLYEQLTLLKKHWKAAVAGIAAGVVTSALCVWGMCALFTQPHEIYVTFLPKSITSAIGLGLAEELGGIPAITVSCIILSGVFGSIVADGAFRLLRIREPMARGLALGASSHGMGTTRAMELGEIEGAMSSLALVVSGIITVLLAPAFAELL